MRDHSRRLAAICFGAALCLALTASAQIYSPLHIFSRATGSTTPLIQGPDGTLYGVSALGGASGPPANGTVFKVQPDGTGFDIIYSFTNGSDGGGPMAGLMLSGNTLYGTAENGGSGGHGTVFKVNTDGSGFATIYSFTVYNNFGTNSDGANPVSSLVLSGNTLYGTASVGGGHFNAGTIFKVNTDGTGFTNLYNFSGSTDGARPMAGMVLSGSTLYGITEGGTIFKIDTSGTGFATLHSFSATVSGTNSDGTQPEAGLVLSGNTLYGTASAGGKGHGTVFSLNVVDSGFTNLYNFTNGVDGSTPLGALAVSGGTLYGTASAGGTNSPGWGTVFKLNTDGTGFSNLYEFAQGTGGTMPEAGLLLSGSTLYGTTARTSGSGGGTIFRLGTDGSGFTVLADGSDGAQPQGGLVLSGDSFYGTTSAGGVAGEGVVFKVGTNGTGFAVLHMFSAATYDPDFAGTFYTNADGATPLGTLASSGGVLYGTTQIGGTFGGGTVFRVNTDGTDFTNLYNFTNGLDGGAPAAGVVLSGNTLYGTTRPAVSVTGGPGGEGTIFKVNTDGTGYAHLHDFSVLVDNTNNDGNNPLSGLVLAGDTLYGTTIYGGPGGEGTLFKLNTNGLGFTNIFSFNAGTLTNVFDAVDPEGGLILFGNTLYGTTSASITVAHSRGGGGPGVVFKVNTDGTGFVNLHTLTNSFDGTIPKGALVLSGGKLYGTASGGGNGGAGTVFQLNTDGTGFATLHSFPFQQGTPVGDLVAIGNTVYGTCEFGAPVSASSIAGAGVVFAVTPTGPPSIQFTASPTNGIPPQAVQFSAPSIDNEGNTLLAWYWDFGDGTPTFTISITTNRSSGVVSTNYIYTSIQNPSHVYTNNGLFFPSLRAENNNGNTNIIATGPALLVVYPSSILNGGFETGTFTNWTSSGAFGSQTISTAANYRHSGTYGAQLTASGALRFLSQTFSTTPGAVYTISFWMHNPTSKTNNEFQVSWNGTILLDMSNLPVSAFTNIQLTVTATAGVSVLQFGYRNDTAYFGLDDVSLSSVLPLGIASLSLSSTNLVLNGTGGLNGRTYFVLMGTNLAEPFNQWTPVATNVLGADGNFSITVTNTVNPIAGQRFYLLQMQ
jgi:uncharacterized repeat protein (TIGR03803 family)